MLAPIIARPEEGGAIIGNLWYGNYYGNN